jgi:hypothetical protein
MIQNNNYLALKNLHLFDIQIVKFSYFNHLIFLFVLFVAINNIGIKERALYVIKKMYVKTNKNNREEKCIYFGKVLDEKIVGVPVHKCLRREEKCPLGKGAYISSIGNFCYNGKE